MVRTGRQGRQRAARQICSLKVAGRSASSGHTGDTEAFLMQKGRDPHGNIVRELFGPQHDEVGTARP